jgi:DDE superfamily endonuclease
LGTDVARSGRPPVHDEVVVVVSTLQAPPQRLGVTHWSARLLGDQLGTSFASVARIWRKWNLQPWRTETFKFSTDPELDAKIRDVVGLYLAPPTNAVVVCVDEKSQVQALDRYRPDPPPAPGDPRTADPRRVPAFLNQVARAYPRVKLHVVADNYATHKHPAVKAWLVKHPRITMHFTPTSASWLNIEIFFGIVTRQAIRRGTFTSVKDLIAAIETFIDGWNDRCEPFVWTKTADDILTKAHRKTTSNTRH